MRRAWFTRSFAALLSVVLLADNCFFAHAAETNFWADRQRAATRQFAPFPPQNALPLPSAIAQTFAPRMAAGGKTLIHFQDVHMNDEAQENIADALRGLLAHQQVDLVALEGAFGPIDLNTFRTVPHSDTVRKSADYLLRNHRISGPVHALLTASGKIPPVIGVDDAAHYNANVDAYRKSAPLQKKHKNALRVRRQNLLIEKRRAFSEGLNIFDQAVEAYRIGSLSIGDYANVLAHQGVRLGENTGVFLEVVALEKRLNFADVDAQRSTLLAQLVKTLSPSDAAALTEASVSYRTARITPADFYAALRNLCGRHGVDLAAFPALKDYFTYVFLADRIDAGKLHRDLHAAEEMAYARLARSSAERSLVDESNRLFLTGKLLDFALTRDEWDDYKKFRRPVFRAEMRGDLTSFEAFYEEAKIRDRRMAQNLQRAIAATGATKIALVAGGFHSSGISQAMRDAGVTTLPFVPKITKVDGNGASAYLSLFTQEKMPLDKLFEGEKLFLALPPVAPAQEVKTVEALQECWTYGTPLSAFLRAMGVRLTTLLQWSYRGAHRLFVFTSAGRLLVARFDAAGSIEGLKLERMPASRPLGSLLYNALIALGAPPAWWVKLIGLSWVILEVKLIVWVASHLKFSGWVQLAFVAAFYLTDQIIGFYGHWSRGFPTLARFLLVSRYLALVATMMGFLHFLFAESVPATPLFWSYAASLIACDAIFLFWPQLTQRGILSRTFMYDPKWAEFFIDGVLMSSDRTILNGVPAPKPLRDKKPLDPADLTAEIAALSWKQAAGPLSEEDDEKLAALKEKLKLHQDGVAAFKSFARGVYFVALQIPGLDADLIVKDLFKTNSIQGVHSPTPLFMGRMRPSRERWGMLFIHRADPTLLVPLQAFLTMNSLTERRLMAFALIFGLEWRRKYLELAAQGYGRYPMEMHDRMARFEAEWDEKEKPFRTAEFRARQIVNYFSYRWDVFRLRRRVLKDFEQVTKESSQIERLVRAIMKTYRNNLTEALDRIRTEIAHQPLRESIVDTQKKVANLLGGVLAFGEYSLVRFLIWWEYYLCAVDTGMIPMTRYLELIEMLARTRQYDDLVELMNYLKAGEIPVSLSGSRYVSISHFRRIVARWRADGIKTAFHELMNGDRIVVKLPITPEELGTFLYSSVTRNTRANVFSMLTGQASVVEDPAYRDHIIQKRDAFAHLFDEVKSNYEAWINNPPVALTRDRTREWARWFGLDARRDPKGKITEETFAPVWESLIHFDDAFPLEHGKWSEKQATVGVPRIFRTARWGLWIGNFVSALVFFSAPGFHGDIGSFAALIVGIAFSQGFAFWIGLYRIQGKRDEEMGMALMFISLSAFVLLPSTCGLLWISVPVVCLWIGGILGHRSYNIDARKNGWSVLTRERRPLNEQPLLVPQILYRTIQPREGTTRAIAVSDDRRIMAIAYHEGDVQLVNLETGMPLRRIRTPSFPIHVALNSDGTRLAAVLEDGAVFLVDTTDKMPARLSKRLMKERVCLNPDGSLAAVWSPVSSRVIVLNFKTAREEKIVRLHDNINAVTFHPDGIQLAASLFEGRIAVFTAVGPDDIVYTRSVASSDEPRLHFSPDGALLAALFLNENFLLDVESGEAAETPAYLSAETTNVAAFISSDATLEARYENFQIWIREIMNYAFQRNSIDEQESSYGWSEILRIPDLYSPWALTDMVFGFAGQLLFVATRPEEGKIQIWGPRLKSLKSAADAPVMQEEERARLYRIIGLSGRSGMQKHLLSGLGRHGARMDLVIVTSLFSWLADPFWIRPFSVTVWLATAKILMETKRPARELRRWLTETIPVFVQALSLKTRPINKQITKTEFQRMMETLWRRPFSEGERKSWSRLRPKDRIAHFILHFALRQFAQNQAAISFSAFFIERQISYQEIQIFLAALAAKPAVFAEAYKQGGQNAAALGPSDRAAYLNAFRQWLRMAILTNPISSVSLPLIWPIFTGGMRRLTQDLESDAFQSAGALLGVAFDPNKPTPFFDPRVSAWERSQFLRCLSNLAEFGNESLRYVLGTYFLALQRTNLDRAAAGNSIEYAEDVIPPRTAFLDGIEPMEAIVEPRDVVGLRNQRYRAEDAWDQAKRGTRKLSRMRPLPATLSSRLKAIVALWPPVTDGERVASHLREVHTLLQDVFEQAGGAKENMFMPRIRDIGASLDKFKSKLSAYEEAAQSKNVTMRWAATPPEKMDLGWNMMKSCLDLEKGPLRRLAKYFATNPHVAIIQALGPDATPWARMAVVETIERAIVAITGLRQNRGMNFLPAFRDYLETFARARHFDVLLPLKIFKTRPGPGWIEVAMEITIPWGLDNKIYLDWTGAGEVHLPRTTNDPSLSVWRFARPNAIGFHYGRLLRLSHQTCVLLGWITMPIESAALLGLPFARATEFAGWIPVLNLETAVFLMFIVAAWAIFHALVSAHVDQHDARCEGGVLARFIAVESYAHFKAFVPYLIYFGSFLLTNLHAWMPFVIAAIALGTAVWHAWYDHQQMNKPGNPRPPSPGAPSTENGALRVIDENLRIDENFRVGTNLGPLAYVLRHNADARRRNNSVIVVNQTTLDWLTIDGDATLRAFIADKKKTDGGELLFVSESDEVAKQLHLLLDGISARPRAFFIENGKAFIRPMIGAGAGKIDAGRFVQFLTARYGSQAALGTVTLMLPTGYDVVIENDLDRALWDAFRENALLFLINAAAGRRVDMEKCIEATRQEKVGA